MTIKVRGERPPMLRRAPAWVASNACVGWPRMSFSEATLDCKIEGWMAEARAGVPPGSHARAVVAPHAGYRYSGHVMAYAYAHIDPQKV